MPRALDFARKTSELPRDIALATGIPEGDWQRDGARDYIYALSPAGVRITIGHADDVTHGVIIEPEWTTAQVWACPCHGRQLLASAAG